MELKCYASGYPQPKIYWRRQDNAILPTNTSIKEGNVLKFPSVKKEHRGTYFCVATNVVGTGARRNVDVEVTFAPLLKVERFVHLKFDIGRIRLHPLIFFICIWQIFAIFDDFSKFRSVLSSLHFEK